MGWKGGYGNLAVKPQVYYPTGPRRSADIITFPRRMKTVKGQSPVPKIPGIRGIKNPWVRGLGPYAFLLKPLLRKAVQLASEPPTMPVGEQLAYNTVHWVKRCTTSAPAACIGYPSTGYVSSNDAFCGRSTIPPAWTGTGRKHIYTEHVRCDTGGSPWWSLRWTSGMTAAAYNTRPVYWSPLPRPMPMPDFYPDLLPDVLPAAQPVNLPQPRPVHVPYKLRHVARRAHNRANRPNAGSNYQWPHRRWLKEQREVFKKHQLVRPGRGERENKKTIPKWMSVALRAALEVTEWIDVVKAIADGLGYNKVIKVCKGNFCYYKRAVPKTVGQLQFIYSRFLDATPAEIQQAILNVIRNEFQDEVIGSMSQIDSIHFDGKQLRQIGNVWMLVK